MRFNDLLKAGYACLYVETHEECRAIASLAKEASGYHITSWELINGVKDHANGQVKKMDALAALAALAAMPADSILFIKDAHKFVEQLPFQRTLKNLLPTFKAQGKHVVFVSPIVSIPTELEKDVTLFPFSLPTVDELKKVALNLVNENRLSIAVDDETIATAKGMTLSEFENAAARSIVETKTLSKQILSEEKLQIIKKGGLMELYEAVPESQLGGLKKLKQYAANRKKGFTDPKLPTPSGILLVGLPGGGKSLAAKVIASMLDVPLIRLDIASLKGSLQGESNRKMNAALKQIDAIGKCVVWLDEIEKVLGGVQSSAKTDGGTTASMFGTLLTWMQESKTKKYIVATCNDIDDLLAISQGAFIRRFDDVFFVDLPSESERAEILNIMNGRYGTAFKAEMCSRMQNWTGAEIEKFVKASVYDGAEDALKNVHPIFEQNQQLIERAREWARFNARLANDAAQSETTEKRRIK